MSHSKSDNLSQPSLSINYLGILTRRDSKLDSFDFYDNYKAKILSSCPDLKIDILRLKADEGKLTIEEIEQLKKFDIIVLSEGKLLNYIDPLPQLPNLKWISTFYAGVDNILKSFEHDKAPINCLVTRNAGYFDQQMAEYVIGMVLMHERHFIQFHQYQVHLTWVQNINKSRTLSQIKFGIVGYGSIGKTIAKNLSYFKTEVISFVRKILENNQDTLPNVKLTTDLDYLLSNCDYVCSVLPKTLQTNNFFDEQVLKACSQKKSVFINIGRGNVIEEATLIRALNEGWISHAILDVVEVEPLPTTSLLWKHPNVTITPHIGGINLDPEQLAQRFCEEYKLFKEGKTLDSQIDFHKGY